MIDKNTTEQYFSSLAAEQGVNDRWNSDKYEVVKGLMLPDDEHPDVLECGGGAGFYTRRLIQDGYRVTCIDPSREALAVNRTNADAVGKGTLLTTVTGDFVTVGPGLGRKFDQVIFIKVFHHFDSLQEIYQAIDIAQDLIPADGRIVIFEPNGSNILWRVFLSLIRDKSSGKSKWFYEQNMRFTTPANFRRYFDARALEYTVGYHYVIPSFILNMKGPAAFTLQKVNTLLEKSLLKKIAFNFSIVVDPKMQRVLR